MTLPEENDDLIGRVVLGRYRIVHRLASGGMGVIYLARSEGAKGFVKPVVIKRILPHLVGDEALVGMFAREARIMSNLSHPGIVGILDFAEEQGAYLMVLEYVHGFHLGRWNRYMRRKAELFPVEPAIHIIISILDALHYAHTLTGPDGQPLHIVHRDISPGNVLIDTEGRIKLTDFGIARMRTDKTSASDNRALKGTFSYMAPELLKMAEPSPKSDLYSAAVVLHEILTGSNEFHAKDVAATAWRVLEHTPSAVEEVRPDVPSGLGDVLKKALAKDPEDRYENALEFAQELRRVRGIAADEAARMLTEAAAREFNSADMASTLKVTDLATLDRKWRETKRFSFRPSLRVRRSDPSSVSITQTTATALSSSGQPVSRTRLAAAAAVGIVVIGLATVFALRRRSEPASQVIMVEGSVSAVGVTPQTVVPVGAPEAVLPPPLDDASKSPSGGTVATPAGGARAGSGGAGPLPAGTSAKPPRSRSEVLTRAFARQQPQIARCFSQHASDVSGNPEMSVRFEVGTDGHVNAAQVQPASLASTALGQCITRVARATEFGPQPEPTAFRIPITAKRGP